MEAIVVGLYTEESSREIGELWKFFDENRSEARFRLRECRVILNERALRDAEFVAQGGVRTIFTIESATLGHSMPIAKNDISILLAYLGGNGKIEYIGRAIEELTVLRREESERIVKNWIDANRANPR